MIDQLVEALANLDLVSTLAGALAAVVVGLVVAGGKKILNLAANTETEIDDEVLLALITALEDNKIISKEAADEARAILNDVEVI